VLTINRPASLLGSAAIAGLLVVGLGACSDEPERDESGAVTEGGDESVFEVAVGDCMNYGSSTGEVAELPVVPCTQPHDSEVYHIYNVPGDDFPGDFTQITQEQCGPAFQQFVGVPAEQSTLQATTLEPTLETWTQADDRELVCIVMDPAGNLTGSLQGAAR
jgi:Septum formation